MWLRVCVHVKLGGERADGSDCCLLLCEVNSRQHLMSETLSRVSYFKSGGGAGTHSRGSASVTDERVSVGEKNRSDMI